MRTLAVIGPLAHEVIHALTDGAATSTEAGRHIDQDWLFLTDPGTAKPIEQHILAEAGPTLAAIIAGETRNPELSKLLASLGVSQSWKVEATAPEPSPLDEADTEETPSETVFALDDPASLETLRTELFAQVQPEPKAAWYLPIQRIFRVRGEGVVVNGTVHGGPIRQGDKATLLPANRKVSIRAIRLQGNDVGHVEPSQRVSTAIMGTDQEDQPPGSVLASDPKRFQIMSQAELDFRAVARLRGGQTVRVSVPGGEVTGILLTVDKGAVVVRFDHEVALQVGQRVVLRRYSPTTLLGGGSIKKATGTVFSGSLTDAILAAVGDSPEGALVEDICQKVNKNVQQLGEPFEELRAKGKLVGFGGLWIEPKAFEQGATKLKEALAHSHRTAPKRGAIPREKAVHLAGLTWAGKGLDRILAHLVERGELVLEGNAVRLAEFLPELSGRQRRFLDRILEEVIKSPVETPGVHELAAILGVPPPAVEEIIRVGIDRGELIAVGGSILYTPPQLEALVDRIQKETGKPKPSAATIRDLLGSTRKYALPLAEYLEGL